MPLYEYECDPCRQIKEILVRNPADAAICPDCGNENMQRLLSVPSAPAMGGRSLPMTGGGPMPESCAAPRCCGGGCQI